MIFWTRPRLPLQQVDPPPIHTIGWANVITYIDQSDCKTTFLLKIFCEKRQWKLIIYILLNFLLTLYNLSILIFCFFPLQFSFFFFMFTLWMIEWRIVFACKDLNVLENGLENAFMCHFYWIKICKKKKKNTNK